MRRNMDLMRRLAVTMEDCRGYPPNPIQVEGYDDAVVGYHCALLVEAGLAVGKECTTAWHPITQFHLTRLTNAGHEFAEKSRESVQKQDELWKLSAAKAATAADASAV